MKKEIAEKDQRLQTKIEDFCSVLQFRVLAFISSGFLFFANFGPGFRVLVPPTPPPPLKSVLGILYDLVRLRTPSEHLMDGGLEKGRYKVCTASTHFCLQKFLWYGMVSHKV